MSSLTTPHTFDPFDTPDFAPEKVTLPWLQVLHNEDPEKAGFFITIDNIQAANITIPDDWQVHKARFKSGEVNRSSGKFQASVADGYLFTKARMLIVRQGLLSMFSKRSGDKLQTYIGKYDPEAYQEQKGNLVLKTRYLIYLLSDSNQLLHESPLQFTGKGVFGATFAQHLKAFQAELQKAYGKQRGEKFLINGVFAVSTGLELRGSPPDTAWVTVIESHLIPTKENWLDLFVGYDEAILSKLIKDYENFSDFDNKGQVEQESSRDANIAEVATNTITAPSSSVAPPDDEFPF